MSREKRMKNNAANLEGRRVAELKLSQVQAKADEEIRVVKDGANDYLKKAEEDVTKLALEVEQLTTQSVGCLRAVDGHAQALREGDHGWSPAAGAINKLFSRVVAAEAEVKELEAALDQERAQHAGCLLAAEGNPPLCKQGDPEWSPAFESVRGLYNRMVKGESDRDTAIKALQDYKKQASELATSLAAS